MNGIEWHSYCKRIWLNVWQMRALNKRQHSKRCFSCLTYAVSFQQRYRDAVSRGVQPDTSAWLLQKCNWVRISTKEPPQCTAAFLPHLSLTRTLSSVDRWQTAQLLFPIYCEECGQLVQCSTTSATSRKSSWDRRSGFNCCSVRKPLPNSEQSQLDQIWLLFLHVTMRCAASMPNATWKPGSGSCHKRVDALRMIWPPGTVPRNVGLSPTYKALLQPRRLLSS
jgi:hypothetical protein